MTSSRMKMSKEINSESGGDSMIFETLTVRNEGAVLFVEISAPAMKRGFQTRDTEMNLGRLVAELQGKTDA